MNRRVTLAVAIMAGAVIAGLAPPAAAEPAATGPAATGAETTAAKTNAAGPEADAVAQAGAAIAEHREELRATDGDEFAVWRVVVDEDGASHVRYTRTHGGLAVRGGDIVVHNSSAGRFAGATVAQEAPITVDTRPTVSASAAAAAARAGFAGTAVSVGTPALVVDATGPAARLAWETEVRGTAPDGQTPSRVTIRTDAATNAVLAVEEHIHTANVDGYTVYSGKVPTPVTLMQGSGFWLIDPASGASSCDLHQNWDLDAPVCDTFVGFGTSIGGTHPSNRATAGVDAHYGSVLTFNYFKNQHKRNGIYYDGKAVKSRVHYGNAYKNAFWDDECKCMTYGDGFQNNRPLVSLDVAGHEMTHGITENSVPGGLTYSGESGGLNEATSDIFGTMVEFAASNGNDPGDYLIGEKINLHGDGTPLRYMYDPALDGKSDTCWNTSTASKDVHYSSGVANHFFFMLAQGSGSTSFGHSPVCSAAPAVTGIGREKAAAIWYRALDVYFTSTTKYFSVPNPNNTARAATLAAAADRYGYCGTEYRAVRAAWVAAGVGGYDPPCQNNPVYGWVRADNGTLPSHVPTSQRNSSGGQNTILRSGVGQYQVRMQGLAGGVGAGNGGTVHVSNFGPQRNCKAADWYPSGTELVALVNCFDTAGNPADGVYTASFTRAKPGGTFGYAWTTGLATEATNPIWSYNGSGGANRVEKLGTGHYLMTFPGLGVLGGTVMVTAQGWDATMCTVDNWAPSGTDQRVWIWCADPQGVPRDSAFEVTFGHEQSFVGAGGQFGYAWISAAGGPALAAYSFNSTAQPITVTHLATGFYKVSFSKLFGMDSAVHVVSQGSAVSPVRCRVTTYSATSTVGTEVFVTCADPAGTQADMAFDVMVAG